MCFLCVLILELNSILGVQVTWLLLQNTSETEWNWSVSKGSSWDILNWWPRKANVPSSHRSAGHTPTRHGWHGCVSHSSLRCISRQDKPPLFPQHVSLNANTSWLPRHNHVICFDALDSRYLKRRNCKHCTGSLLSRFYLTCQFVHEQLITSFRMVLIGA